MSGALHLIPLGSQSRWHDHVVAPTCLPLGNCSATPYPVPLFSWPHGFVPANSFPSHEKACLERPGKASFSLLARPGVSQARLSTWPVDCQRRVGPLKACGSSPRPTLLKHSTARPGARTVLTAETGRGRRGDGMVQRKIADRGPPSRS